MKPVAEDRSHLDELAQASAQLIYAAFIGYNDDFRAITRRAAANFESEDWRTAHADAVERIDLYDRWVDRTVAQLADRLGAHRNQLMLWRQIKAHYGQLIKKDLDKEFTKTFFSSITRRLFKTVGVNPAIEFVAIDAEPIEGAAEQTDCHLYDCRESLERAVDALFSDFAFTAAYGDLPGDSAYVCGKISEQMQRSGDPARSARLLRLETIKAVFYQGSRAYVVGRVVTDSGVFPLILALSNRSGINVEAVLLTEDQASILFGFARSYFHVDLETVIDAVAFLRSIMPRKPVSELYTMLGRAKQGKTERYRSFFHHLAGSDDYFVAAAGQKGMVMAVFTLPSYDVVFKVIRDRFAYPKNTSRQDVVKRYQLVFKHDRAGRLIDAQEFKQLRFARDRFDPALLQELLAEASAACHLEGQDLIVEHCYVERRMTPLDLFLRSADQASAERAVIDYGQAITDLARTNIFPGDLLSKNFGVSRHGRVIFYDYDELCLLDDCNFRDLPEPETLEEEMESGAWFYVADNDVFPEQFGGFLGLEPDLLAIFKVHYQNLLEASYWRDIQRRIGQGEVLEVLPYRPRRSS